VLCVSPHFDPDSFYLSFFRDSVDARVLTPMPAAATPMTVGNCVDACSAAGFTVAGVDYSSVSIVYDFNSHD